MVRLDPPGRFGLFTCLIGVCVWIGCWLDIDWLMRIFPGLISLKPDTALAFILSGASLWALRGTARSRRYALGLAALVGAISVLTLFERATGIEPKIDEITVHAPPRSLDRGSMHPATAFDFGLLAVALALLASERWYTAAHLCTLSAALMALSAILAYFYGDRELSGVAWINQMAPYTAAGLLVLTAGILRARPDRGLMAVITANTAGGLLARKLLPIAVAAPVVLDGLTTAASEVGLVDDKYSAALRVVLISTVFFGAIIGAAHLLHGLDLQRRRVEEGLCAARDELNARMNVQAATESALRASEHRYRFLADAMPQIVWTARPEGDVDYHNVRWSEYTGISTEQSLGYGWTAAIHPDDLPTSIEQWQQTRAAGTPFQREYRLRRHGDGAYRWHLVRALPMPDDDGQIRLWIGTCTDIDDYKRVETELRHARLDLEDRVRERTAELAAANQDLEREVGERRRALADFEYGERRYRSLVGAITAIVWSTPESGEFESEQTGWSQFTGQTFDELKGWGWLGAIHPDDRAHTAQVWSAAVANRTLYEVEHRIRRHDGQYRHMLVRAVPIIAEDGSIREWIGVHSDIEEQIQAKEALRIGKETAEAATRAKSEFLANMSHEIRTPMNGILGMTELALATPLSSQQREYLGLVKSSADSLLTVINDILDFSKIEAGKLDLDPIPFNLRDCVEGTLKTLAVRAHPKGLELSCRVAPDIPDRLVGDSGRLQQILVNLVGNAIKFTDEGEIVVSVDATRPIPDTDELELRLEVRDTGIGIPADKLDAILEPFTQADGSTTRKHGGTGLGLAISRKLVEMMNGRLSVESQLGQGSTFQFTVTMNRQSGAHEAGALFDPERLRDLPILIVDDNQTNRRILEEVLTSWGATPTAVDGGPAALAALWAAHAEGRPFAIVLLDVMMPGMDGYAVAERIATLPSAAKTLVVLLTSNDCTMNAARRHTLRIAASLTKPVRQSELFDLLMRILHPADDRIRALATAHQPAAPDACRADRPLKILLAEDQVVNQKVVTRMLEIKGHTVTIAANGLQAKKAHAESIFDVILMDVQMPEMDGFEALSAIRSHEILTGQHTPVIALTAHAMQGDRERCLAAGFDSYLSKPIRSHLLHTAIDEVVASRSERTEKERASLAMAANGAPRILEHASADHSSGDYVGECRSGM